MNPEKIVAARIVYKLSVLSDEFSFLQNHVESLFLNPLPVNHEQLKMIGQVVERADVWLEEKGIKPECLVEQWAKYRQGDGISSSTLKQSLTIMSVFEKALLELGSFENNHPAYRPYTNIVAQELGKLQSYALARGERNASWHEAIERSREISLELREPSIILKGSRSESEPSI